MQKAYFQGKDAEQRMTFFEQQLVEKNVEPNSIIVIGRIQDNSKFIACMIFIIFDAFSLLSFWCLFSSFFCLIFCL